MSSDISFSRKLFASIFIIGSIVLLNGCQPGPVNNTSGPIIGSDGNTNTNSNSNALASQPDISGPAAPNTPVTLPLLDAMLADEAFVNEAKSTLQITDEEIQKLRDSARDAVLSLSQEESSDDTRSTRASVEKAKAQVRAVLGAERGDRFIALAQQRWSGEDGSLLSGKPNAVPTDTRIVVNAPAYRMDIFKDGQLLKSYKIGIGYPEFPLPTGLRKANTIIFNPTWTPPDEPWVKGKVQPGKKIEAGSKLNPLGPIKIPIGYPSLVHGGKSPDGLGTFASHGCVGLTNPMVQDFAMQLSSLAGKPLTMEQIKKYEKEKSETTDVKLEEAIPVELRYETIVVEDGRLKIYRDVYERGTNTEENLRRVLETFDVSFDGLNAADRDKILAGLEMMAIDAQGKPVEPNNNANKDGKTGKASNSGSGKVTRNIKGKKELVFDLPELRGKGYPAALIKNV